MQLPNTLKGVAASIGASGVSSTAAKLEADCAEVAGQDRILESLAKVENELSPLLEALESALSGSTSATTTDDPVDRAAVMMQLKDLLSNFDTRASEVADGLSSMFQRPGEKALMEKVIARISTYDFNGAMEIFAELERSGSK